MIPSVAITGHIDLLEKDIFIIREKLIENFRKLKIDNLLVGNANGVDQIAQEVATELGIKVTFLSEVMSNYKENDDIYALQAEIIVENCDHIIVVWDGVFTGKLGGTSDIVHRTLKSNRPLHLYQLVCPRESNPHPVASLLDKVIDFDNEKFSRIPFALPFSWLHYKHTPQKEKKRSKQWWENKIWMNFALPGLFLALTLGLGTYGFTQLQPNSTWEDNFFRSINLVTFNSSVFEPSLETTKYPPLDISYWLYIARFLGLLTASYTLMVAVWAATENMRKNNRLKRWSSKHSFTLVLGLNQKSFDLTKDLLRNNKKVVIVHTDHDNIFLPELKQHPNIITVQGNLSSSTILRNIGAPNALKVFIMGDTDSENIRAIQELDILDNSEGEAADRFVHLEDENKRRFLHNSLSNNGQNRTNIFNIYENTVRRLFLYHPVDRFYLNPLTSHTHAVIIGFDKLGKHLVINLLKQGHYARDKYLDIAVYCKNAQEEEEIFLLENPQFRKDAFKHKDTFSDIYNYTWSNIHLSFEEIPVSDVGWLSEENSIFRAIKSHKILNLYACLEDGIQSATYLNTLLPSIDYKKKEVKADVQVFCYYNFPDIKEEDIIEDYFNKLAPNTFVKCFGNYMEECSASAIHGRLLDSLPKLINAAYNRDYDKGESFWKVLSEKDKVSNRQAADHLWVKIRQVWPKINWKFDPVTFEPDPEVAEILYSNPVQNEYGEIEHRRWCADLLLQGFVPFVEKHHKQEYQTLAHRWDNEKGFKASHQIQKRHISLVPYEHLTPDNQKKDINQINEIPEFLRRVVEV